MYTLAKKISIIALYSLCAVPYLSANDPTILSVGVTSDRAKYSYPGSENKSKGYSSIASLSKLVYDGWYGSAILGYANSSVDVTRNSGSQDVDVTIIGLAGSKSLGHGLSVYLSALYGKNAIDSTEILSGTPASYSIDGRSLILSGGLNQVIPSTPTSYTTIGAVVNQVTNTTDAYRDANGTSVTKSHSDFTYLTLNARQTWIAGEYRPYAFLQCNISNQEYSTGSNDTVYYRWGLGTSKSIRPDLMLGVSFSKLYGKDYSASDSFGLNVTKKF